MDLAPEVRECESKSWGYVERLREREREKEGEGDRKPVEPERRRHRNIEKMKKCVAI